MKVPLSWLGEFISLSHTPQKISEALTLAGLEEEGMEEKDGDTILDIGLTPNLGHCMSMLGMARELSAILELPLKPKTYPVKESSIRGGDRIQVAIENTDQCTHYACRLVEQVKTIPSPDWLVDKLEAAGIRSVSVAVDIGNYVMLETGQPLHMFDADKIEGNAIFVKADEGGKTVTTLDEQERETFDMGLMIYDAKKPIAFAGVMGELSSSINESTKNILIEAAHFTPEAVRKTSKMLNLRSDSSSRFERGIDPKGIHHALDMAAHFLSELMGGHVAKGIVEHVASEHVPHLISFSPKRTNSLLGIHLSIREMVSLLERLEIEAISESEKAIKVRVPSYRNDLRSEIDIIEEVGRLYGFNNIPRHLPRHNSSLMTHSPLFLVEEKVRTKLVSEGLQECLTCDLIGPKLIRLTAERAMRKEAQIHVLHPASIDQSILRPSLLPGLLEVIKFNLDRQNRSIAAFEVGHIHYREKEAIHQDPCAGIILTGLSAPYHFETKPEEVDFFHLKGYVENLLSSLGLETVVFTSSNLHNFHPGRQARISIDDHCVGILGQILPSHLQELGIDQRVFYAEVNILELMPLLAKSHKASPLPSFPASERDWTATVSEKLHLNQVFEAINSMQSSLLERAFLLDIYRSKKLGTEFKNITLRFTYRDTNKTVAYAEVEEEHKRITTYLAEKLINSVP